MGNVYGAQNMTAYLIGKLNESHIFVNNLSIQHLLASVENTWQQIFGHSAFHETVAINEANYTIRDVFITYEHYGTGHIPFPEKDYYLTYGTFQLEERPYELPSFTQEEEELVQQLVTQYRLQWLSQAS
ncbi:hypothetical protein [Lysinibacillus piscis]|uniref:Uncharacterized protein n=1 Tax=Lysinibacillus piscis TaxID=2518931 RepID=A0ABQ5NI90_9BACI|nr:hypothetical protein [Lysinibacillus sp. KH24]GLC88077.1 hypothetical protein LYSBPC_12040 [Lysinibacillus sp. KH24]